MGFQLNQQLTLSPGEKSPTDFLTDLKLNKKESQKIDLMLQMKAKIEEQTKEKLKSQFSEQLKKIVLKKKKEIVYENKNLTKFSYNSLKLSNRYHLVRDKDI